MISVQECESGNSTCGVKGMERKRIVVVGLAVAVMFAMVLPLAGCTADDTETTGSDATSELPPQEGLEVGVMAPDFRMQSQDQVTVALKDYVGTKNVVLVFYPADFTPV